MTDAVIWFVSLGIVVAMFWALIYEQKKRTNMSDEEYQKRATTQPTLIRRGLMEMDQILFRPAAKAAIEYQQDKLRGQTADQQQVGDWDVAGRPAPKNK